MNLPTLPAPLARGAQRAGAAWRRAVRVWRVVSRFAAAYWPGRRTVLITVAMVWLFMMAGASAAEAADGGERGGVLAPLNVLSSEGAPLDSYDLTSENGGTTDIRSHVCNLLLGAGFALVRILVGLMCWVIQWIFNFPVVSTLVSTAQKLNSAFFQTIANDLELYALFLAAGTAFGCVLIMRGKVGRGMGEMLITILLSTLVLLPALSPKSILGPEGPLMQSQLAAHEVGQLASGINGPDPGCKSEADAKDPSCPMRMVLTRTLVVQPFQLLQYGQIPENGSWLAGVHDKYIHGQLSRKGNCDHVIDLPGRDAICDHGSQGWDALKEELKDRHGQEGKDVYNYAVNSNWDRVGGTLLVFLAVLIIATVVLSMCLVHLGTQFADVTAASLTAPAMVWAMLPGGNRSALWKWLGVFMTSVVTEFAISIVLPLFGLGANEIMTNSESTLMIQRLLILDGFALVILVFHRRIFASAGQLGERFANRMRYAKIGGSLWLGENSGMALAMSQAMGTLSNPSGVAGMGGGGRAGMGMLAGGGLFGGGSGVHGALMRKARIAEGLAALADPGLGRMNAGAMAMGAYGEVRRGMSALALPFHAAHQLVVGNPLPPHKLARRMKPVGPRGPLGGARPDGAPGHPGGPGGASGLMSRRQMPEGGLTPAGHALHNTLLNTRAGRLAIRAGQIGKLGFDATVGLPATWTGLNRRNDAMWDNVNRQWEHYSNVRKAWWGDQKEGLKDWGQDVTRTGRAVKTGYNAVQSGYNHLYHRAATFGDVYSADLGGAQLFAAAHVGYGMDPTDTSEVFAGRPSYSATAGPRDTGDSASGGGLSMDGDFHGVVNQDGFHPGPGAVTSSGRPRSGPDYHSGDGAVVQDGIVIEGNIKGRVEGANVTVHGTVTPDQPGWGASDNGPADIRSALGPDVAPPSRPTIVTDDGHVVDPSTGEVLADPPARPAPPAPAAPAVEGIDPDVMRRVSPEVLRSSEGTSVEALRLRRNLGHSPDQAGGTPPPEPSTGRIGDES
ncbi:hypothetical protein [Kitasatospora sp. NBC_01300]|uniref:hypothetical protein n=1 Tax=Kitasatospora sp. NBC_01300 TaxID=2903574 RepID=UPI002F9158A4|nr:hypothetical protein OG556_40685 [Kitasatospora sp. NBC_01300]